MGGFGSGDHNRTTRLTVEECEQVTIRELRFAVPRIRDDEFHDDVSDVYVRGGLAWVTPTRQPSGGVRCWFQCRACGTRAAKLFRPDERSEWRCRRLEPRLPLPQTLAGRGAQASSDARALAAHHWWTLLAHQTAPGRGDSEAEAHALDNV